MRNKILTAVTMSLTVMAVFVVAAATGTAGAAGRHAVATVYDVYAPTGPTAPRLADPTPPPASVEVTVPAPVANQCLNSAVGISLAPSHGILNSYVTVITVSPTATLLWDGAPVGASWTYQDVNKYAATIAATGAVGPHTVTVVTVDAQGCPHQGTAIFTIDAYGTGDNASVHNYAGAAATQYVAAAAQYSASSAQYDQYGAAGAVYGSKLPITGMDVNMPLSAFAALMLGTLGVRFAQFRRSRG